MSDILLTIDGKEVKAKEGMTVLEAAQSVGIQIPTLCYIPNWSPSGGAGSAS
jgi:NADH dehydrogenase/NADH:ubiquinone oxidoreductase subunit G